jgi:dynein heavy chain
MSGKSEIKVLRQNQPQNELIFQLETAISFGTPVLLENIGEDIDPIFEAVLQNKKIK